MDAHIHLGVSRMGVTLDWKGSSNFHMYVSGQSGQGKSCFLKHCITQLPQQGVRCIVFDYAGDLHTLSEVSTGICVPCDCLDVRNQVCINPFRTLFFQEGCPESHYDTAVRIAETILSACPIQGNLQQVCLRNTLKEYMDRGGAESGFPGLVDQIQNDRKLAQTMAPALLRLQDLANLLPHHLQTHNWNLEQPGITVLCFDGLPNISAQTIMTQFMLADLWSEKLNRGLTDCPLVIVLDECQRFRFTESSIFTRILREGRKYHFSGWFASQWINNKSTLKALNQAALQAYFYPGDEQIYNLAKRLAYDGHSAENYRRLLRTLRVGEFLYIDKSGRPIISRVPQRDT